MQPTATYLWKSPGFSVNIHSHLFVYKQALMPILAYASASYLMNSHFRERFLLKCNHSINTSLQFWYFLLQQKRNRAWAKKHWRVHLNSVQWNNCNEQRLKIQLFLTDLSVTQDEKTGYFWGLTLGQHYSHMWYTCKTSTGSCKDTY